MAQKDRDAAFGEACTFTSRGKTVRDDAPVSDAFTEYDEQQFGIYLSLLFAETEGAEDEEMIRTILRKDPSHDPERAVSTLRTHLARARWLATAGLRRISPADAHPTVQSPQPA